MLKVKGTAIKNQGMKITMKNRGIKKVQQSDSPEMIFLRKNQKAN